MKRSPSDTCINPYNPVILKCIRANMDIQYITDVWACVAYITSYMCKPEKSMSDLMRNACQESTTLKTKLKSIGNVFLKSREVSQHEAIARLTGLPLRESNFPVMFFPTSFKHERTRMVKLRKILEKMDDEDTDVFLPNIIDKYMARPDKLESMCLAQFASSYTRSGASQASSEHDDVREDNTENLGREKIYLKDDLGTLVKRKVPQVLRDNYVSKDRNSEKYYHRLLLLYFPWRREEELQIDESYKEKFNFVKTKLVKTIQHHEPYLEELQEATEMLDNLEADDAEILDELAPHAEQIRCDEEQLGMNTILDTDNLSVEQRTFDEIDQPEQVSQPVHHSITTNISFESESTYLAMIRSLNPLEKKIHDHVLLWCRQMNMATSVSQQPQPFHIFLSGGAGVGKSHTVHTIYQTAIRTLKSAGSSTDSPTIILTAPTGKAAVNIGGTTLHNAFRLPVRKRNKNDHSEYAYKRLSAALLNSMRAIYCQLKILVIDEISMVGATTLSNLKLTVQDIFENERPFGNIAVFALGDLMQLNPVGDKAVYKEIKSGYAALALSVWELFKIFELTEIIRQKEDPLFAQVLSRIRVGQQTKQDLDQLNALEENTNVPNNSLSIFLTNKLKDNYNLEQLHQLPTKVYTVAARDSRRDLNTKHIAVNATSSNLHETAGLASEVKVAEMAKYMQTKNVDIPDGLVNCATGTIMKIDIPEHKLLDGTLYVKFDDPNIGKKAKANSTHKNLVPITAVTAAFSITEKSKSIQVERTQFPGTLAWGITVHKSQGSTFEQMLGDMTTLDGRTNTKPGQIYTMLSRAKSMKGLKLRSFHADKIRVNVSAFQEMERLKDNNALQTETLCQYLISSYPSFCVLYLNIRSLRQHFQDISSYVPTECTGFLCFSETKVFNYSTYKMNDMKCISGKINDAKHGNVIYSTFKDIHPIHFKTEIIETLALQLNALLLVSLYITPGQNAIKDIENLLKQIESTVSKNQIKWIIVIGDFNLSFQQLGQAEQIMKRYNLLQLVTEPTHELGAVLDLAFTNMKDVTVKNEPVWFSDHHAIILRFPESS